MSDVMVHGNPIWSFVYRHLIKGLSKNYRCILWGMKDIAFREQELNRWTSLFLNSKVIRYTDAGHFVQEEKGEEIGPVIEDFLKH